MDGVSRIGLGTKEVSKQTTSERIEQPKLYLLVFIFKLLIQCNRSPGRYILRLVPLIRRCTQVLLTNIISVSGWSAGPGLQQINRLPPEFPEIPVKFGWRKTISRETQEAIPEEIRKLAVKNPRIYIAAKWMATYINARPGEIMKIMEGDIDREQWIVYLPDHKTDRQTGDIKLFPLIPEDIELVKQLPQGFPNMPCFRRDRGGGGKAAGTPLESTFSKKGCMNLGIEGIGLYGGTRHSSATDLRRKGLTPEAIQNLTGHGYKPSLPKILSSRFGRTAGRL